MCKILDVSRSAYYSFLRKSKITTSKISQKDVLKNQIQQIYEKSKGRYGSVKVWYKLKQQGVNYSQSWVTKLMHEMGLQSIIIRK